MKHVEQSRNNGILNCPTQLHLVGPLYKIRLNNIYRMISDLRGNSASNEGSLFHYTKEYISVFAISINSFYPAAFAVDTRSEALDFLTLE